jgi:formate dehydrogenase iron-sulfur subunit
MKPFFAQHADLGGATGESPRTLIDDLLEEQQRLTAVERFARKHERHALPAQERYYRDLIPLEKPALGEQYAFAVDLDNCTGCKACVSACHSLNGLDDGELWRTVGLLHGGHRTEPYAQTITTACHHCVDPACAEGCPVLAYEKDEETGIVRHLDDQCIGCQYCVLKCPYDVPKYSAKRGIVRKCDMCQGRLAAGEAPACVQACPNGAIRIEVVRKDAIVAASTGGARVTPGAFESSYTKPTTRFATSRTMPADARPADAAELRLDHAHWPLIAMLVLTQAAAGAYAGSVALGLFGHAAATFLALAATLLLHAGLAVSVLHLGRPLGAWRFFLGLRTSWMSREILAFTLFAGAGSAYAAARWFGSPYASPLGVATVVLATIGVACSAMIYVDTRRPWWSASATFGKFFGSVLVLGLHAVAIAAAAPVITALAVGVHWILAAWETSARARALDDVDHPRHRPALIARKLLHGLLEIRVLLLLAGALSVAGTLGTSALWPAVAAALFSLGAIVIERIVFFRAAASPRMPGGVPS